MDKIRGTGIEISERMGSFIVASILLGAVMTVPLVFWATRDKKPSVGR